MNEYIWETAEELDKKIADRVRLIRKRRSISQEKLAQISGVSFGSVKRFETTGQISLLSLTKIAMALDMADDPAWTSSTPLESRRLRQRTTMETSGMRP